MLARFGRPNKPNLLTVPKLRGKIAGNREFVEKFNVRSCAAKSPFLLCQGLIDMRAAVLAAALALSRADVSALSLWTAYTGWPTCYRQPLLLRTGGTLLAVVEGRPGISYCSGTDWPATPDFPILVKRSTDSGASWSSAVNITRGNLDFLVAVVDAAGASGAPGRVLLLLQQGDTGVVQTHSDDGGATWAAVAPAALTTPPGLDALIPGVGHGLQVSALRCLDASCGGTAGRLILPFVATKSGPVSNDTACGTCATALVVSDDGGASWALAAVSEQNGSREAALVQLDSAAAGTVGAAVYAAERNLGNSTGSRWHALSLDGGRTFARYGVDAALPDVTTANWTGVVAGLARFDAPGLPARPPRLFFTAPNAAGARANLTMWVSEDQAATWSAPALQIFGGPAAYSDALQINDTHVGVVFEGSPTEFAGGIWFSAVAAASVGAA